MRLIFSWQVFVVPIIFGIIMTMLAALGSARSATSVTPLEALRPIELTDTKRAGIVRAVLGILMVVAGIAMAVFSVWRIPLPAPRSYSSAWCSPPSSGCPH